MKTKKESCKGTVVSARRLRQYLQLLDKNSRSISRYSFILFVILQNSYIFILIFLSKPQTVFCDTLRFRGTQSQTHCKGLFSLLHKVVAYEITHTYARIYTRFIFNFHKNHSENMKRNLSSVYRYINNQLEEAMNVSWTRKV